MVSSTDGDFYALIHKIFYITLIPAADNVAHPALEIALLVAIYGAK